MIKEAPILPSLALSVLTNSSMAHYKLRSPSNDDYQYSRKLIAKLTYVKLKKTIYGQNPSLAG